MTIDFYYNPYPSHCRSVQMVAKAVGVELNLKTVNTQAREHLTPEFIKLNPQHTIPTLVDDGFAIWESRVILTYLAEKYGDESLYPTDPQKRALVNQRLYFDLGTLTHSFGEYFYPQLLRKEAADPEKLKKLEQAFAFLDIFLDGNNFVAGNKLTVADIAIAATVSTIELASFDLSKYANVSRWYAACPNTIPGWDVNLAGLELAKQKFGL